MAQLLLLKRKKSLAHRTSAGEDRTSYDPFCKVTLTTKPINPKTVTFKIDKRGRLDAGTVARFVSLEIVVNTPALVRTNPRKSKWVVLNSHSVTVSLRYAVKRQLDLVWVTIRIVKGAPFEIRFEG